MIKWPSPPFSAPILVFCGTDLLTGAGVLWEAEESGNSTKESKSRAVISEARMRRGRRSFEILERVEEAARWVKEVGDLGCRLGGDQRGRGVVGEEKGDWDLERGEAK